MFLESEILVFGMSTVWKDTDGCAKQYMCDFSICLMAVLSSSYSNIMNFEINALCRGKNVVNKLNALDKGF